MSDIKIYNVCWADTGKWEDNLTGVVHKIDGVMFFDRMDETRIGDSWVDRFNKKFKQEAKNIPMIKRTIGYEGYADFKKKYIIDNMPVITNYRVVE